MSADASGGDSATVAVYVATLFVVLCVCAAIALKWPRVLRFGTVLRVGVGALLFVLAVAALHLSTLVFAGVLLFGVALIVGDGILAQRSEHTISDRLNHLTSEGDADLIDRAHHMLRELDDLSGKPDFYQRRMEDLNRVYADTLDGNPKLGEDTTAFYTARMNAQMEYSRLFRTRVILMFKRFRKRGITPESVGRTEIRRGYLEDIKAIKVDLQMMVNLLEALGDME